MHDRTSFIQQYLLLFLKNFQFQNSRILSEDSTHSEKTRGEGYEAQCQGCLRRRSHNLQHSSCSLFYVRNIPEFSTVLTFPTEIPAAIVTELFYSLCYTLCYTVHYAYSWNAIIVRCWRFHAQKHFKEKWLERQSESFTSFTLTDFLISCADSLMEAIALIPCHCRIAFSSFFPLLYFTLVSLSRDCRPPLQRKCSDNGSYRCFLLIADFELFIRLRRF